MTKRWRSAAEQRGQATFSLIIVIVVVAIAVVLLQRTAWHAESINGKAGRIAQGGGNINDSVEAVLKLDTTTGLAGSILETAEPLEGKLNEVIRLAASIDNLATSINGTASTINNTAKGINGTASTILGTARSINDGVAQINTNLDTTLQLASEIKRDTGDILGQAVRINKLADSIDSGVLDGPAN